MQTKTVVDALTKNAAKEFVPLYYEDADGSIALRLCLRICAKRCCKPSRASSDYYDVFFDKFHSSISFLAR